ETAGVVRTINVRRGQTDEAGQILLTLDATAEQSDLAAALAREQVARTEVVTLGQGGKAATLASLNDAIKTAQAVVDVAQRNYEVLQRLATHQAATKLQVQAANDGSGS